MIFRFILILLLSIFVNICCAQNYEYLNELHLKCEEAYLHNDFVKMKASIDARCDFVESGKLGNMSQSEYDMVKGMYYKDLGSYYSCISDIDKSAIEKAKTNYLLSLDVFGDNQLLLSPLRTELAQLSYRTKDYSKALNYLEDNYKYYQRQFIQPTIITLSQIALCKAQMNDFEEALSDINNAIEITENERYSIDHRTYIQKELFRKKAKILCLKHEFKGESSVDAVEYYKDYYYYMKDSLVASFNDMSADERERYWLRMQPFIVDCYRLEDEAANFLYDITLFSKSILLQFSKLNANPKVPSYKDIQNKLDKKECAIEFIRYEKNDEIMLGALVLRKDGVPKFIKICSEKELLGFKGISGIPVKEMFGKRLPFEKQMKLIDELYESKEFGKLIWNKDLRKELKGVRKIYFSPDGPFHQLAIEYLYRGKKILFYRLTSTRELLSENHTLDHTSMLLCGGIEYETAELSENVSENDSRAFYLMRNKGIKFGTLIGTKDEVEDIFTLRDSNNDTLVMGSFATEQNCYKLFKKYPIVHIATHGYFGGDSERFGMDIRPRTSDLTMSSSVIILAGSMKNVWDENFNPSRNDGILSARELSEMKLDNVDLFIVSACQSGLGYVTSDGVYGIQRGLKNAGVKALIVSLWEVNDIATKYFMVSFNKALMKGCNVQKAFDRARKEMNAKYEKPRYKNAFVLIDGNVN